MASNQKQMKILTKYEQKKSIKGIRKPKKNIIKNYLESPFALEWPEISTTDEEEITALLQKSCSGLHEIKNKPPWKEVIKYRGDERKAFLEEYNRKFIESLNSDNIKQNNKRKEAMSHLILGYNAVMRSLEKDRIAGILVKKNVDPMFITKSFLPGCAKKCIPLIPLNDLDVMLKAKETLDISHACMVLGLKPSVTEESNLFHPLYVKMRETLNITEEETDDDTSEDDEEQNSILDDQENATPSLTLKLSESEIKSYHLKRTGNKGKRAFTPNAQESQVKNTDSSADFISFKSSVTQNNTIQLRGTVSENVKEKPRNLMRESEYENLDFTDMILIDASGDENHLVDNHSSETKNLETLGEEKQSSKTSRKAKKGTKRVNHDFYVSAKTKRVKGNPNRKSKRKS